MEPSKAAITDEVIHARRHERREILLFVANLGSSLATVATVGFLLLSSLNERTVRNTDIALRLVEHIYGTGLLDDTMDIETVPPLRLYKLMAAAEFVLALQADGALDNDALAAHFNGLLSALARSPRTVSTVCKERISTPTGWRRLADYMAAESEVGSLCSQSSVQ